MPAIVVRASAGFLSAPAWANRCCDSNRGVLPCSRKRDHVQIRWYTSVIVPNRHPVYFSAYRSLAVLPEYQKVFRRQPFRVERGCAGDRISRGKPCIVDVW